MLQALNVPDAVYLSCNLDFKTPGGMIIKIHGECAHFHFQGSRSHMFTNEVHGWRYRCFVTNLHDLLLLSKTTYVSPSVAIWGEPNNTL